MSTYVSATESNTRAIVFPKVYAGYPDGKLLVVSLFYHPILTPPFLLDSVCGSGVALHGKGRHMGLTCGEVYLPLTRIRLPMKPMHCCRIESMADDFPPHAEIDAANPAAAFAYLSA